VNRPRILIGGAGERRTLPLVARYADACNLFDIPDGGATLRHKLEVLANACDAIGRDRSEIETTVSTRLAPSETGAELTERCTALSTAGVDHVVLITSGPWHDDDLNVIAAAVGPVGDLATSRRA
jgi:alkanesulfonate monooxygenase SsuD/methylene tetrahydromethanopterin reductase-like flavin-dependent oxidoreductase (luciferase family)